MHRDFQVALEPLGIEPAHVGILTALEETGPISQSELARLFAVSGAHMVQLVDELEQRRLLTRRRLETDRRSHVIEVLPSAGARLAEAAAIAEDIVATRFSTLTAPQSRLLIEHLRRLVTAP